MLLSATPLCTNETHILKAPLLSFLIVTCFIRMSPNLRTMYHNIWYSIRSISLDPEEDVQDPELFCGLARFLNSDLESTERERILVKTIPRMVDRAKALRSCKPPQGLHFSLQQQGN